MPIYGRPALRLNPVLITDDLLDADVGAAVITANTVYLIRLPRVATNMTLTAIEICNGATVAGNLAAGLMTTTDPVVTAQNTFDATFTRVAHTGAIAAAGTSTWQSLPLTASYTYLANTDLWVAFGGTDGTHTVYRTTPNSVASRADGLNIAKASAYSSGIPTPLTGMGSSVFAPVLKVR